MVTDGLDVLAHLLYQGSAEQRVQVSERGVEHVQHLRDEESRARPSRPDIFAESSRPEKSVGAFMPRQHAHGLD